MKRIRPGEPGVGWLWALALWLAGSAGALGGAYSGLALGICAAACVLCVTWMLRGHRPGRSVVALVCFGLAAFTLLQLLPLPFGLLRMVAPRSAEAWSDAMGPALAWAPVTLDRAATALEVVKWSAYGMSAALGAALAARFGLARISGTICLVLGLLAVVALAHRGLGAETVFGVYSPVQAPAELGPILNANNLAGFANLGAMLALGLYRSESSRLPLPLVASVGVLCLMVSLLTASRGGVFALAVGLILSVLAGLARRVRRRRRGTPLPGASREALFLALWLTVGIGVGIVGWSEASERDLWSAETTKLSQLGVIAGNLSEHVWLGVGRGAFDAVSGFVAPLQDGQTLRYVESWPLAWATEWGIPATAIALLWLGYAVRPSRLALDRSMVAVSVAIGVAVVLLQNLVDMALELPTLSLCLWVLAGGLEGSALDRGGRADLSPPFPGALALASAALGAGIYLWLSPEVASARVELHDAFVSEADGANRGSLRARLLDASRKYPLDAYAPYLLLLDRLRANEPALHEVNVVLTRAPGIGRYHLVAAWALGRAGASSQALGALRRAIKLDAGLVSECARALPELGAPPETWAQVAPDGPGRAEALSWVAHAVPAESHPSLRRAYLTEAANLGHRPARLQLLVERMSDFESGRQPCEGGELCPISDRASFGKELLRTAKEDATLRGSCVPTVIEAAVVGADVGPAGALPILERGCDACEEALECLRWRVDWAEKVRDGERLRTAERAFLGRACMDPDTCAIAEEWLAGRAAGAQELGRALAHYRAALQRAPTPERAIRLAEVSLHTGDHRGATQALGQARALGAPGETVEGLERALRKAVLAQPRDAVP